MMVAEAEENLRLIRQAIDRSRGLTNFAGISGIFGGCAAIVGAFVQRIWVLGVPLESRPMAFIANWSVVILAAVLVDYAHVKRRAEGIDRSLAVRLTRQSARAAWPPLLFGALLTFAFLQEGRADLVYPYWMLAYGCAVSAVALGCSKELAWLGRAFLGFGAFTLLWQTCGSEHVRAAQGGLAMVIPSFGILNIAYGIAVGRRDGW